MLESHLSRHGRKIKFKKFKIEEIREQVLSVKSKAICKVVADRIPIDSLKKAVTSLYDASDLEGLVPVNIFLCCLFDSINWEALGCGQQRVSSIGGFPVEHRPEFFFDNLIGEDIENVKTVAEKIIDKMESRFFEYRNMRPMNKILLVGPEGSGKTESALAIIQMLGKPFLRLGHGKLSSMPGSIGENLKKAFELAEEKNLGICIDECDWISPDRGGYGAPELLEVTNRFLQDSHLWVIATANIPKNLDISTLRSGRFDYILPVRFLGGSNLRKFTEVYFKKHKVLFPELLDLSFVPEEFSPAAMKEAVLKTVCTLGDFEPVSSNGTYRYDPATIHETVKQQVHEICDRNKISRKDYFVEDRVEGGNGSLKEFGIQI